MSVTQINVGLKLEKRGSGGCGVRGRMFKRIEEFDKFVSIIGFRNVKIVDVNQFVEKIRGAAKPALVQMFDADRVAGFEHLFFAILNALRAFSQKNNISETVDMESLLYASGQRQIRKAIEMTGVKLDTSNVAVLILADDKLKIQNGEKGVNGLINGVRDDQILEVRSEEKIHKLMKLFNVTELELRSLSDRKTADYKMITKLIIERGALLATSR